ncbi:MAG TPA: LysM peptidoglycan-binding domain-containing protein, partial [Verrucomicrobiae bacterium]|nr:LysM peptidoglycan-binding domain-containing protein [Verrucomicrobiae bacterium]
FAVIAKKYGVTISAISKANPGVNSSKLKVGQKLQIPAPVEKSAGTGSKAGDATGTMDTGRGETTSYTVKPGDTIIKIAKGHGTTAKAIRAANNLKTDRINVGQKLKIPARTTVAAAPDTNSSPAPVVPAKQ